MVLYVKAESYFIEFKEKFHEEGCGSRFYLLIMIERIIAPGCLVALSSKSYGTAPVIVLYLALAVVLCSTRPYKGSKKNFRPMANYIIMIVIAGILLAIASSGDASGVIAEYGPLVILVFSSVCS